MEKSSPEEISSRIAEGANAIDWLRHEVEVETLLDALKLAPTDHVCMILCDILGWRHEQSAVPQIITLLEHNSSEVRSSAVDALAKIGDPSAGSFLLGRLELPDPDIGVRRMLLAALGAVRCREAIPLLIEYLHNPDPSQRGSTAWSLGAMQATEALAALQDALRNERSQYPQERMTQAIRVMGRVL